MLEAPSAPEIKGELHNILFKPEEAGGEPHRLEMTRPRDGDTNLLRENEHDRALRWRKSNSCPVVGPKATGTLLDR